jgi:putative transposase
MRVRAPVHPSGENPARLPHLWVQTFDTIEELRQAPLVFRQTYNVTWLIERHGFITPAAFRQQQLQPAARAA